MRRRFKEREKAPKFSLGNFDSLSYLYVLANSTSEIQNSLREVVSRSGFGPFWLKPF